MSYSIILADDAEILKIVTNFAFEQPNKLIYVLQTLRSRNQRQRRCLHKMRMRSK